MESMWRAAIRGITFLSALLAVGMVALWVASVGRLLTVERTDRYGKAPSDAIRTWTLSSGNGSIEFELLRWLGPFTSEELSWRNVVGQSQGWQVWYKEWSDPPTVDSSHQLVLRWHGFEYGRDGAMPTTYFSTPFQSRTWIAPIPFFVVVFGLRPAYQVVRRFTRRKFPAGHCRKCGYDLRASANQCPECGAVVGGGAK